jgi:hypothetical protein
MSEKTVRAEEIRSAVRQQYGQIAHDFGGAAVGHTMALAEWKRRRSIARG